MKQDLTLDPYTAFWGTLFLASIPLGNTATYLVCNCVVNEPPQCFLKQALRVVGNVLKPVNFVNMASLMHVFGSDVNSLVWNGAICSSVMVTQAFWKPVGGCFSRSIPWRKVKTESRVNIHSSTGITLLFLQTTDWSPQKTAPSWEFGVGIISGQSLLSAEAVPAQAWWKKVHFVKPMHSLYIWQHDHFVLRST